MPLKTRGDVTKSLISCHTFFAVMIKKIANRDVTRVKTVNCFVPPPPILDKVEDIFYFDWKLILVTCRNLTAMEPQRYIKIKFHTIPFSMFKIDDSNNSVLIEITEKLNKSKKICNFYLLARIVYKFTCLIL